MRIQDDELSRTFGRNGDRNWGSFAEALLQDRTVRDVWHGLTT
jgi:hypothetical protein